jgi:ABC-type antimicrobial peptide transport system ATPase subunit
MKNMIDLIHTLVVDNLSRRHRGVAPMMLVRQQAQALIDARSTIVQGAVAIVHDAITKLEDRGHAMTEHHKVGRGAVQV